MATATASSTSSPAADSRNRQSAIQNLKSRVLAHLATRGIDLTSLGFSTNLTTLLKPGITTLPRITAGAF
jgi:hypothetical protein